MYIANSIGCIFRNASHSHVIKLLKGSGTNPTLLVSDNRPSVDKRRLSRISSGSAVSISDHRRRSAQFTKHVRIVTVELRCNLASTMCLYTSFYRHLAFLQAQFSIFFAVTSQGYWWSSCSSSYNCLYRWSRF